MNILKRLFARDSDFKIGRKEDVYMHRWYIIPRNRFFNIYLHKVVRDDDPVGLHDHPWWNVSIVLKGGYFEVMPLYTTPDEIVEQLARVDCPYDQACRDSFTTLFRSEEQGGSGLRKVWRKPGSIVMRSAIDAHRLELEDLGGLNWQPGVHASNKKQGQPCWSLFITGPRRREWGFWTKTGWRPQSELVVKNDQGNEFGAGSES